MTLDPLGRLMLVEDERILRELVYQFLTIEGYQVDPVEDGQEAVETYSARGPYDLILMDLNLPRLPGVEASRRIRMMNSRQPILVCSAAILESHIEALNAIGVSETLAKPYHPAELLVRLRRMLIESASTRQLGADAFQAWRRHERTVGRPHSTSSARINSAVSRPESLPD